MDWKTLISDIQRASGMTQPQIAAKAGCSQASISDLLTGKTIEPKFSIGNSLIQLHKRYQRKLKQEA